MSYTNGLDNPELYFQTKLYTGNATARSITFDGSENMQPDWTWIKIRTQAYSHRVFDSVRGAGKFLHTDTNEAEGTNTACLSAFNTNGFSLGDDNSTNQNGDTFASWNWKAGTSFTNDASSTGIGSIDSAGSVNDTAGFSICTHTGTGSTATIKHGLSTAPKMIITKKRSATGGWQVGHESIGWGNGVYLNDTDASTGDAGAWNSTAPTSSIFTVGNSSFTNQSSATYVSYIFAEKKGYSKFGSYTGNGSTDGTFVYTGFKPAFLLIKITNSADSWRMWDNKRNTINPLDITLRPNTNNGDYTASANNIDFLSNGFKFRTTSGGYNGSGDTHVYMAFAENPFVTSTGIPTTAR
jgi:hypothetical protein